MDLTALSDFNAVALYGGFGPASRALDRPKATLSRRVAELEDALGVRLIERGARRMRLTEEGMALHERTHALVTELQEAGEAVASRGPVARGRLRVSAPVVYSHVVLSRIAARFALAYPDVELELVAEDRVVDPVEDGFDLVIRVDPPTDERLMGRRIQTDELWLVATPTVSIPPRRKHNANPIAIPAVVSTVGRSNANWSVLNDRGAAIRYDPRAVLRLSSLLMVREAVLTGVGAGMLPKLLVEHDVKARRLVRLGKDDGAPVEIWALYHSRRLLSVKVKAFLTVLQEAVGSVSSISPRT